ncbi:MAG: universal stress protein [Candidatus Limnocylindrales bacterium]
MRVVVGLDSSASSRVAHGLVTSVTWPRGSSFVLVAAFDDAGAWATKIPGGGWFHESTPSTRRPDLLESLEEYAAPLRRAGHVVELRAEAGPVGQVLRDTASREAADLIVVGSRGRGVAASAIGGSTSADLTDHAPCPVLIARRPSVSRVLVATDGSRSAEAIPDILARWRFLRALPTDVVSVAPRSAASTDFMVTAWAPTPESGYDGSADEVVNRHHRYADELAERLRDAGWNATPTVRVGDAAHQIVQAADELASDLIITGSRGLGDLKRLLIGSVAHDVLLHSRCSVLVIRGHVPARLAQRAVVAAVGAPA